MKECAVNRDQVLMAENEEDRNAVCGIKLRHFRTDDRGCPSFPLSTAVIETYNARQPV